ncbi:MAG TPA: TlpA disulfide reductase family protein [Thermodesulfobacteriota bacterium]|nr:TlpA disulfide reductase family protein [Thermodesulfobacteriota bacterium]
MKKNIFFLIVFFCSSAVPGFGAAILSPGMKLPAFRLSSPASADALHYLGLTKAEPFSLSQVSSKLILVEILSVFCQYCQKQTSAMNRIYQYIQEDQKLAKDIKMIGIVAVGDQKAVAAFKTAYRVKFPLIPDPKMEIFGKLQNPAIPLLLLVNRQGDILLTHSGYLNDADDFFGKMKKIAENQK